jgi:hypothetical protein
MTSPQKPFITKLTNSLPYAEIFFLIGIIIGAVPMKMDAGVLTLSMIGLAIVFSLYMYKPIDIVRNENEPLRFSDFVALNILPKIMWISSAVSVVGLFFYLFDLGNDGYKQMIMVGGLSIGVSVLLLAVFLVSGVKNMKTTIPILLRAVPLLIIDLNILFK